MEKRNKIGELSFEFALMIIDSLAALEEKREHVIAKPILSPGTSIPIIE